MERTKKMRQGQIKISQKRPTARQTGRKKNAIRASANKLRSTINPPWDNQVGVDITMKRRSGPYSLSQNTINDRVIFPSRRSDYSLSTPSIRIVEAELAHRQRINGGGINGGGINRGNVSETVGILIADYRRQFCKENIINQLGRLNRESGPLIDFYIPGYVRIKSVERHQNDCFGFQKHTYYFSRQEFDRFVREIEHRGLKVTGRTQLLLVPYENHRLRYKKAMAFDLEQEEASGKIESTKLFFDFIIEISKKTTEFEEFKRRIQRGRARTMFLDFLKEKLPDTLLSLITSPFSQ